MSMKLNLGLLATKLSQADPEDTIPPVDCNAYLVDKIFLPLSRGETVSFQAIDYSQFDETDIGDLEEYNEYVVRLLGALERMAGLITATVPAACSIKQFC